MRTPLLLVGLLCLQTVQAHIYFGAYADGDAIQTTAEIFLFDNNGTMEWKLNITNAPPGPLEVAIVDGDPLSNATSLVVALLSKEDTPGGDLSFEGSFTSLDPASSMPDIDELKEHSHMGHIWLQLTTAEGAIYGVVEEANDGPFVDWGQEEEEQDADHTMDHDHAHDGEEGHAHEGEEEGHAHEGEDDHGHTHRRMLSA